MSQYLLAMIINNDDYRTALRKIFKNLQATRRNLTLENAAEVIGIHASHLSRFFNGKIHLSEDQLYLLCNHLGLADSACRYLELQRAIVNCKVAARRQRLQEELAGIVADQPEIPTCESDFLATNPKATLVLALFTVAFFQDNPQLILNQTGLRRSEYHYLVDQLLKFNLLKRRGNKLVAAASVPGRLAHQQSWFGRQMLELRKSQVPEDSTVALNAFFVADAATEALVKEKLAEIEKALQGARRLETPAAAAAAPTARVNGDRNVFQISFDFLDWSRVYR